MTLRGVVGWWPAQWPCHWTIEATAERFQVDAKTVRKWRDRYLAEGDAGLLDRSSRPRRSPNRTPRLAEEQHGSAGVHEPQGGEVLDESPADGGLELEVELGDGLAEREPGVAEPGGETPVRVTLSRGPSDNARLHTPSDSPLSAGTVRSCV